MRITAFSDDKRILDTSLEQLKLINPKVSQEDNKVGAFTFTIYPDHPYYNFIEKMKSIITVYEDGIKEPLFRGRIYDEKTGFYNEKQVSCEGELAFLLDSIQRPYSFPAEGQSGTPAELFTQYINNHNAQVDEARQFKVGNITVTDPNNYIVRSNSDYVSTWDELNAKLIDHLGGHLWVRHESDGVYIDYLADFEVLSNQVIEFGKNLLDLEKNIKAENFATALIPLGYKLKDEQGNETGERLTIKDVNNNVDFVYNAEAVDKYGYIFTTNTWDDVTEAYNLKTKGQAYIDNIAQFTASIEVSAADLNGATINGEVANVNSFRIGRYVKVNTIPHSIQNQNFIVSKLSRELLKPENTKLVLGTTYKTLTEKQLSQVEQLNQYVQTVSHEIKNIKKGRDAAIQSDTEPTDKDYMWLDTSANPPILKRWNGDAWVIVNDMTDTIALLEQRFTADINTSERSLKQTMSESYYTKEAADKLLGLVSSSLEHTAQGFEMQFNNLNKNLDDVSNNADTRFQEISKYIRFVDGNIVLGVAGSELVLKVQNDRISFLQNNTEVAYFSDRKLYVTDGEYTNSLQLGKFAFIPRTNGNLSFKKIID